MRSFLVIEDQALLRMEYEALLKDLYPDATIMGLDSRYLEHAVKSLSPDLIITDLGLSEPRYDGVKGLQLLCMEYPNTPVIVVSGHREFEDMAKSLNVPFLLKPICQKELIKLILDAVPLDSD